MNKNIDTMFGNVKALKKLGKYISKMLGDIVDEKD